MARRPRKLTGDEVIANAKSRAETLDSMARALVVLPTESARLVFEAFLLGYCVGTEDAEKHYDIR